MPHSKQRPSHTLPRRWLVTGGCGFVGSALVNRLVTLGVPSIRIVDDLRSGSTKALPAGRWKDAYLPDLRAEWAPGVRLVRSAVEDRAGFGRCAQGADAIVHLAGCRSPAASFEDPFWDLEVGVGGVLSVLEAARLAGVRRVVLASGAEPLLEYAAGECVQPAPRTVGAAWRVACESYAQAYHHEFGLETISLRFGRVYGPGFGAERTVVGDLVAGWSQGRAPQGADLDADLADLIHLRDLVDGLVRAASAPGIGGQVLVLSNHNGAGPDTTPAKHLLGWEPATPLEEGLKETVAWLLAQEPKEGAAVGGESVA